MRTLDQLLGEHPFFEGFPEEDMRLVSGCAKNLHLPADTYLFHEGEPADQFYVIRHGRIALEIEGPGTGRHVIDTLEDGDVVGWSWLVPPHRRFFDARSVESTSAIAFDGRCLRTKCEEDPRLGFQFMERVAAVMYHRLQAARVRLLDLYGGSGADR